jgi:putative oxidoreductase
MSAAQGLWPLMLLRVICGVFFIPHAIGKFTAREAAIQFFGAAGFRPAAIYASIGICAEVTMATFLICGWYVRPVAWIAALYLLIAVGAVVKVSKKWLWHLGGCEYPLFWALSCIVVGALD